MGDLLLEDDSKLLDEEKEKTHPARVGFLTLGICLAIVLVVSLAKPKVVNNKKLLNIAYSPYAIMHDKFECKKFIKSTKKAKRIDLSIVWNSFGNNPDCLLKLLNDTRTKSLQIHAINEVCNRNRNCGSYEFLAGSTPTTYSNKLIAKDKVLLKKLKVYFAGIRKFLDINLAPWTTCYISPGLESNLDYDAGKVLVDLTRESFPNCLITWNTMKRSNNWKHNILADLTETHAIYSDVPAPCIYNLDGGEIRFPGKPTSSAGYKPTILDVGQELDKYMYTNGNKCRFVYLWTWESNCYETGYNGPRPDPRTRNCNSTNAYKLVGEQVVRGQDFPRVNKDVWTYRELDIFKDCNKVFKKNAFSVISNVEGGSDWILKQDAKSVEAYTFYGKIDRFTFASKDDVAFTYTWKALLSPELYPLKIGLKIQLQDDKLVCYQIDDVTALVPQPVQ